jgi:RNA-binding protein Nova
MQNEGQGENTGSSTSDGGEHLRGHLHQNAAYGNDHELSFFEPGAGVQGVSPHSIPVIHEGMGMGPRSGPIKSDTGSPPPNSATTSGSTSTPTSIGGLSSGGEGPLKSSVIAPEFPRDCLSTPPRSQLQSSGPSAPNDPAWSVSLANGMMSQSYTHLPPDSQYQQSPGGQYNPSAYPSAIKILVSNNVAGSIIGRSGQTISELQTQSSARIKLSQTGDYYPGTQDRVCLVQGQLENVKLAARLLLERLFMLQEQQHSQHLAWHPKPDETGPPGFDFVVRLLVPSSSCGMIIGKAGSNIKHMEEESGVSSVRLSPKETSDPSSPTAALLAGTAERVVTLTGQTVESCLKCLCIVLDGMMSHHEISRYANMTTSYSRIVVAGSFGVPQPSRSVLVGPPTGSPETSLWDSSGAYASAQFIGKRSNSSPDLPTQMIWDQRGGPRIHSETNHAAISRHIQRDVMSPYNPVFGDQSASFSHEMPSLMHSPARRPPNSSAAPLYLLPTPPPGSAMEAPSMSNSASAPDLLAGQLQESLRLSNSPSSGPVDYLHFAPEMPQPTPPGFTAQVLVPDTLIGSILGRGGRTLNELQMRSGTRIRISQRGEYVPGTRNRIVTIRGPSAQGVSLAQYLMSQRMVLPPTATYSPSTQYHLPPQHQPRLMLHHTQEHFQQRPDIQHQQYRSGHENVFHAMEGPSHHHSAHSSRAQPVASPSKELPNS